MIFLLGQRPHCPKHQGWCWMFPHSLSLQSPHLDSLWSSTWKHLWVLRTSPLVGWFLALGSLGHYLSKWARATGRQTPPHSKWRARLAWAGISGVWTSCTWLHTYLVTSFFDLEPEFLTETVTNCNLEAVQVEHGQCHRCPPTVVHFLVNKHFLSYHFCWVSMCMCVNTSNLGLQMMGTQQTQQGFWDRPAQGMPKNHPKCVYFWLFVMFHWFLLLVSLSNIRVDWV